MAQVDAEPRQRPTPVVSAALHDLYVRSVRNYSDFHEHVSYCAELVVRLDAQKVIELGTRSGVSTAGWLYGLAQTGGHLWSVDLDPAPDLPVSSGWTFIQGNDLDPAVTAQLPDTVDIVFIDTDHRYAQTLAELNVYYPRVRPGGKIVLHDTENARPLDAEVGIRYPVKRAVEEFCNEELLTWTNHPNCWGLGVVAVD